jgi:hypothetical protein
MRYNLIKTDNYLLVVDGSEIKAGDYHVATRIVKTNGDNAIAFTDKKQLEAIAEIGGAKKIIAHLPLNNSPILEGVPLLPPLEQEDDAEKLYPINRTGSMWMPSRHEVSNIYRQEGYNKAKEKFAYTKEQLIWAIQEAYGHGQNDEFDGVFHLAESIEAITKHLSQPKMPIGFECEESIFFATNAFSSDITLTSEGLQDTVLIGIKTTTNSQGQTVLVGKYIY